MAKKKEEWRGTIVVMFAEGTSQERIQQIVQDQGCTFIPGFDGKMRVNCIRVKPGEDERFIESFSALPEVQGASLNNKTMRSS
ncbi:MAG: hypothetical protein V4644_01320 [Patescibacteria group bacterium]